ncbi:MAG: diacylglycerol kinase family protein [Actinomycetes bacterium]
MAPPAAKRKILVVVNPAASSVSSTLRSLMISALATRFEVTAAVTEAKGHAVELAEEAAAQELDGVIAFGGDGTANEVANGVAGSAVPLSCLPGGSANVYCGVLGIPRDLAGAVRNLLRRADDWRVEQVDAASVNGRRFLFTSGVGLDARILEGVDARPDLKRRWRQWWFVTEAGRTISADYRFNPPSLELESVETTRGVAVVVQNGRPWTYFGRRPVTVSKNAGLVTGTLAATVVGTPRPWDYPSIGWRVLSGRGSEGHPRITEVTASNFSVRPLESDSIDIHVDGDHIGRFDEARYSVEAGAMRVVC